MFLLAISVSFFFSLSGLKAEREKRESGYFSLGRAAGARSVRDNSPPGPYRHVERGHPIFSSRCVEPKDAVPFRNPNLGVASERQIPEFINEDLPEEIPPPDPYEIAVEVEAQVGPRSPSPTPFKIAESLASSGRKGFSSSFGRGNSSPQISSYQQSGRYDSSRQSSGLHSRSSSPSRGDSLFRRSESSTSLNRRNFDGGGWSEPGTRVELGTLPRNFKPFASSVKSQNSTVSDFRSALRKREGSSSGKGVESGSSSPSRRELTSSGQLSQRRTYTTTASLSHGYNSRTSSPSRQPSDSHSSLPPRRHYRSSSQSLLRKSESVSSLNGRSHHGRCGSPIREGYDIDSQALLRNSSARNGLNDQEQEVTPTASPSKRGFDTPSQSILRKTGSSSLRGQDSRSSSPGRRSYETQNHYQLKKTETSGSLRGRSHHQSRNSSPSRNGYEARSQSLLFKSEFTSSVRGHGGYSSSTLKKSFDAPDQRLLRKSESTTSLYTSQNTRNSSPSRKGNDEPPGYSVLRCASNGVSGHNDTKPDSSRSTRSWRESAPSLRSSSLSRAASPSRPTTNNSRTGFVRAETPKSPGSIRSGSGRYNREDCQRTSSYSARSPSPSPQMRRHTSSQSSMESSESGQLSAGSTGRNREEYAIIADVPKVKMIHPREDTGHMGRPQKQQPPRRQELFKPARSETLS